MANLFQSMCHIDTSEFFLAGHTDCKPNVYYSIYQKKKAQMLSAGNVQKTIELYEWSSGMHAIKSMAR